MGKFKKGDRVRCVHGTGTARIAAVRSDGRVQATWDTGGASTEWWESSDWDLIAPVAEQPAAPATLVIEAGRYYKTRDGRKVGPAKLAEYPSGPCKWTLHDTWMYQDDGTAGLISAYDPDLIAEWIEPQAAEVQDIVPVAIIAVIENGRPKPANYPFVHSSREEAEVEAKRLSTKHLGKEFGVFELVTTCKEERQFDHEWQRLAVNGEKISAIKEIRRLTGFGLKSSKDGLEDWLSRNAA